MVANLAEAKSHQISQGAFLDHDRAIGRAVRAAEDASAEVARTKKAAKNGAVNLDAYKFMQRMRKLDEDEQAIILRSIRQYAEWLELPWGSQLSMLDAPKMAKPGKAARGSQNQPPVASAILDAGAGAAGLRAGRMGEGHDTNPHPYGTEDSAAWSKGCTEGHNERATAASMAEAEEDEPPAGDMPATQRPGPRRGRSAGKALDNARAHLNGGAH